MPSLRFRRSVSHSIDPRELQRQALHPTLTTPFNMQPMLLAEMTFTLPECHPLALYVQSCRLHNETPLVSRPVQYVERMMEVCLVSAVCDFQFSFCCRF
jgi:hypothetical protein